MLELGAPPVTATACHWDQPQCVQVRWVDLPTTFFHQVFAGLRTEVQLTDSKLGAASPVHRFTPRQWRRFRREAYEQRLAADGMVRIGDLAYTADEWLAFLDGLDAGEFDLPAGRPALATTS